MAFEPYVRRHWPYAIISWSRFLSGRLRDPLVGGHILIGVTYGAVIVVLITTALSLAAVYGLRLPSLWMLSGANGTLADALQSVLGAVTHGLSLLFFAFFSKLFLFYVLVTLPLTADLSAPATGASILMLCSVVGRIRLPCNARGEAANQAGFIGRIGGAGERYVPEKREKPRAAE
jgi:hypothetical protein